MQTEKAFSLRLLTKAFLQVPLGSLNLNREVTALYSFMHIIIKIKI